MHGLILDLVAVNVVVFWFYFCCDPHIMQAGLVRASLEGLQKKMAAADYSTKVPARVQTENSEKVVGAGGFCWGKVLFACAKARACS
jgi:hypothetical protein